MNKQNSSRLKRPRYPMPEFVLEELHKHDLEESYYERPPYQQNDYVGWITRAKRKETQEKRLAQMIAELRQGDRYMKMVYQPVRPVKRRR